MLLSVLAVAAAGILMGLRFRASALLVATGLLVVACYAWNRLELPGHVTLGWSIFLAFVLAGAYVAGLFLSIYGKRSGN